MPIPAFVLFAASTLLCVPCCFANDVDPAAETATAAPVATHGLFSSWFGSRASRTDAVSANGDDSEVESPRQAPVISRANDLVVGALGLLGIGYRFGGNTPSSGFDCSGMVRYVFQNTIGRELPRRAEEISRVGTRVDRDELKPGDLVFYKTLRKTFSHVGIYLGNNLFIHAPSAGGAVRVDDMSQRYWTARFNGARRVDP
jgi:cell wall-associated NlpC family hydrolase